MSDTKENNEVGQGVPANVNVEEADYVIVENENSNQASTSPQLGDDHEMIIDNLAGLDSYLDQEMHLEVQPVTVEETSKNFENVSNDVKIGKDEVHAEDEIVKPKVVSEGVSQENVQDTLHSVPVEADDAHILDTAEGEDASDVKVDAQKLPPSSNGVENEDIACQNNGDVEMIAAEVEVKPEVCEAAVSKACDVEPISLSNNNPTTPLPAFSDANEPILSNHNDPTTPQPAPDDTKPGIKNVLEVESKDGEEQVAEPVDNENPDSPQNMFFLDADHYYDGNESGTEEDQSAFMKELENFFRERSMDFKPPKFYGEWLNCLK